LVCGWCGRPCLLRHFRSDERCDKGGLVGIDHSKKEPKTLNGKVVALRKDGEATIKRLRIVSEDLMLGMPDNPDFMHETVVLRGEEINNAIIGKVVWWWGLQK
jgi:SOS-response transcriptional repressor LexA